MAPNIFLHLFVLKVCLYWNRRKINVDNIPRINLIKIGKPDIDNLIKMIFGYVKLIIYQS